MAYYLQMDGIDDRLLLPSMTFTEIELNILTNRQTSAVKFYADARTGMSFAYLQSNTNGTDTFSTFNNVYVDGVNKANNAVIVPDNQRVTVRIVKTVAGTDDVMVFGSYTGSTANHMKGNIYSIKMYNGTNLLAHYDMNTGTVQDQSGNGRHATLFGGTWVNDGPTLPVGSSVSASYSLAQRLFATKSEASVTKQSIYKTAQSSLNLSQLIHATRTESAASKQYIFSNKSESSTLRQAMFAGSSLLYASLQSVYKNTSTLYDILTELYSDYVIRTDDFALKIGISLSRTDNYLTAQRIYKEISALKLDVKQTIFKAESSKASSRQIISRLDSIDQALQQSVWKSSRENYATMQSLLEDFREYRQVVEFVLEIKTTLDADIRINSRLDFDINI